MMGPIDALLTVVAGVLGVCGEEPTADMGEAMAARETVEEFNTGPVPINPRPRADRLDWVPDGGRLRAESRFDVRTRPTKSS